MTLDIRWEMARTGPGRFSSPADFSGPDGSGADPLLWISAIVPGTVGLALAAGRDPFNPPAAIDDSDWWFRGRPEPSAGSGEYEAVFEGLSSPAEVWIGKRLALTSDNMFVERSIILTLPTENGIFICFRSLNAQLKTRRERPIWKTRLVRNQQHRWFRNSLLGRMPGWTPPVPIVGPWRPIRLTPRVSGPNLKYCRLVPASMANGHVVRCDILLEIERLDRFLEAFLIVGGESVRFADPAAPDWNAANQGTLKLRGVLEFKEALPWWPHTHGAPNLASASLLLRFQGRELRFECGRLGFKRVELADECTQFRLRVNGVDIFCRGACWTVDDILSPAGNAASLRQALQLARDAGMNMLRVGGTMCYESPDFYSLCDELGILVWQDFMFASMEYPFCDPAFFENVRREAECQLPRLAAHACMAVYCGGSEIEQQAAMSGAPKEIWRNRLFKEDLPGWCREFHPDIPFVPSTPFGGALPFHTNFGTSHYYGVGAYMRPLADARASDVKFATECLAFSNIPEDRALDELFQGGAHVPHSPLWKQRVPRDSGVGWDFEDVRDHYLKTLFRIDPVELRYSDPKTYLDYGRVAVGETMAAVFSEWRSPKSRCRGGLVWFFKDLTAGAGWGILDSGNFPKSVYYYLKRVLAPQAVILTDEGLNGVDIHIVNDGPGQLWADVQVRLLRDGVAVIAEAEQPVCVSPRSTVSYKGDDLLGGFYDPTFSYRFGPGGGNTMVAVLRDRHGRVLSEAYYFQGSLKLPMAASPSLETVIVPMADPGSPLAAAASGRFLLRIKCDRLLQAVHLSADGFACSDNYFHLAPNQEKLVELTKLGEGGKPWLRLSALNLETTRRISIA